MQTHSFSNNPLVLHHSLPIRFVIGVMLVFLVSLVAFWALMNPAAKEMGLMAVFLSATAIVSIVIGFTAYRSSLLNMAPSLRWSLLAGYILSSVLTFINVWITARLMFASFHDLLLATILLLFASGIAVALGFFLSTALSDRIKLVKLAAQTISQGDLNVRLVVPGKDEMSDLADTFNKMANQLQEAQKKQAELETLRRDLIAWVSHDLQTPLASIRAILEALADGVVSDPDTVKYYLTITQSDIRQLSGLIDDLFQMAQIDAGGLTIEIERASLKDLLSDTLESFSPIAQQQGIEMTVAIGEGVDSVIMDTGKIGRVLNNLISNAIRHTQSGGIISLEAFRVSEGVGVKIFDSGEGIAKEDIEHIFDRFYRGEKSRNRETGGAGLGLAIARGIIQAHGGEISVESSPEQGTSFFFTLPDREMSNS